MLGVKGIGRKTGCRKSVNQEFRRIPHEGSGVGPALRPTSAQSLRGGEGRRVPASVCSVA